MRYRKKSFVLWGGKQVNMIGNASVPIPTISIDHSLARLQLVELSITMNQLIKADESRIRFEQRGNLNRNTVPTLILQMQQQRADEWASRTNDIYCDVWLKQGNAKSGPFLRAVFAHGIRTVLCGRAAAIASGFTSFAVRTAFPVALTQAHLRSLELNMRRLEDSWRRRIEIEAKECEHSDRIATSRLTALTNLQRSGEQDPTSLVGDLNRQPAAASRQSVVAVPNRMKPGPRPKRSEAFTLCAGTLWRNAQSTAGTRISITQLAKIAFDLDAAKHLPPADYLEDQCARQVRDFNSRNSRSKNGPLLTWSRLVAYADKDHLRGMRHLLSRCAEALGSTSGIRS